MENKLTEEGRCTFADRSEIDRNPPGVLREDGGWSGRIMCECAASWCKMSTLCYYYETPDGKRPNLLAGLV